jgi:hypothetical protein
MVKLKLQDPEEGANWTAKQCDTSPRWSINATCTFARSIQRLFQFLMG